MNPTNLYPVTPLWMLVSVLVHAKRQGNRAEKKRETSSSNSRLLYTGSEEGSQLEKEPEQISSMRRSPCSIAVKEEKSRKRVSLTPC